MMARAHRVDRRGVIRWAAVAIAGGAFASGARTGSAQTPAAGALPPEGAAFLDRNATAEELVDAWFGMLSLTGAATGKLGTTAEQDARSQEIIRPVLDPAFLLQRASGERYVAGTYVPADIDLFTIADVRETRPTDALVVARYAVQTTGASTADSNLVMSDELAPRLTVFRWDDAAAQWKVLSHANFNTPVAAICDHEPLAPTMNPEVATSAEDTALGVSLVEAAAAAAVAGDTLPVLDPQIQVQTAGGYGYTTTAERPGETKLEPSVMTDFLVTRNGDAIVVSFRGRARGEVNEVEMGDAESPRLITFRLNEQGEWKAIATAYFSPVAKVPEGVDCAAAG